MCVPTPRALAFNETTDAAFRSRLYTGVCRCYCSMPVRKGKCIMCRGSTSELRISISACRVVDAASIATTVDRIALELVIRYCGFENSLRTDGFLEYFTLRREKELTAEIVCPCKRSVFFPVYQRSFSVNIYFNVTLHYHP